jgi:hypothetical protein
VALYRKLRPDVVTMDFKLPDQDGDQVVAEIRAEFPEARVVLLSIFENSESIWRATQAGVLGYVSKAAKVAEVIQAIRVLVDHDGAGVPASNISISTVGNPDGIRKIGELVREEGFHRLNLALSLNAPNDEIRTEIMPVNRAWPMARLKDALLEFPRYSQAAFCVEYVLIPGVNDSDAHCDEVCAFLRDVRCSLNVIPYNPRRNSPWPAPDEADVERFVARAVANGQFTKRRGTKGRNVMAACGQLGNERIRNRRVVCDDGGAGAGSTVPLRVPARDALREANRDA